VVFPDFQPMTVAEEPVCIYLFRAKSSFYLPAFEISRTASEELKIWKIVHLYVHCRAQACPARAFIQLDMRIRLKPIPVSTVKWLNGVSAPFCIA
jgi:hypothetical protein